MKHRGIKFYSPHDMSTGWHLCEVEEFFLNWDENIGNSNVNTILELYNIKRFFDASIKLERWTEEQLAEFEGKCKEIPRIMGKFCSTIDGTNIGVIYSAVNLNYTDDFWSVVCDYKVYKRIGAETFSELMASKKSTVWSILKHKALVASFGETIAEHLKTNPHTAEKLISHFLEAHDRVSNQMHFPVEFTQEMRDKVLLDYVDHDDGNLNYMRLLEQAQSTKEFPVSDRLKLKARRKCEILQEKLFARSAGMSYGAQVSIKSIPDGCVEESMEDGVICKAYSREWIQENQDFPTLLNNFIHLFGYVDRQQRSTFPSLISELGIFERYIGVKGKKDYQTGVTFNVKQMQSMLQMQAYQRELQSIDIQLENLFKWFFEEYLKEEFNAIGFTYSPPSTGTTYAEKCKLLAIAIDGVLKQYRLFCEDGYVDRELLEMSSGHVVFGDLVSMRKKKYAYINSEELRYEEFKLYSDQSMMTYTEKTGSKYDTLPQLLTLEAMTKDDFEQFQYKDLDWLMSRGSVFVDADGFLRINRDRAFVLKDLFINEVICPAYYSPALGAQVEQLVSCGDIRYEETMFSIPEQDYLNYVLNKSEFSNGLDLRNRYSHDTYSLDEKVQRQDYLELLKIMVLIIIKINEEFCNRDPS